MNEIWTKPQPKTFYDLKNCKKRNSIHQGGSRSGKTYSIVEVLIGYSLINSDSEPSVVTICRKTLPALKATVYRDFQEILFSEGLYNVKNHNKTELTYTLGNTLFEFISVDNPQKVRGRKRNICFMNEANEMYFEDYRQLNIRTSQLMIMDFNPSEEFWVHTELIGQPDTEFNRTWYIHNPFIDPAVKAEILKLKDKDENYWRIYGLGELGIIEGLIFQRFELVDEFPENAKKIKFGLDFGYTNDPTAFVKTGIIDDCLYVDEMIYRTGLRNNDICNLMKSEGIISSDTIIADSSEPKSIDDIHSQNFNIHPAVKGADSVINGIDNLKRYKLCITKRSVNLIKELKNYKWKQDKNGKYLNSPIDAFNHAIDAIRYSQSVDVIEPSIRVIRV